MFRDSKNKWTQYPDHQLITSILFESDLEVVDAQIIMILLLFRENHAQLLDKKPKER